MKAERELFLYELEGRGFIFKNKTWIHGMGDVGGLFDDDQLNMVWDMWCASAQREGYRLVPVETLEECLSWANCASSESWNDEQRDEIDKHYKVIEKAMIGAAP